MLRLFASLYRATFALLVVGALNWGLVGLFRINLVRRVLGAWSFAERAVYALVGLAGLLAGVAITLRVGLGVFETLSRRPGPTTERSIVGEEMPTLSGKTLTGRSVALPDDARGKPTFILMGFGYDARFDAEDWLHAFRDRFGDNPNVDYYLVPVISDVYRLVAPMIDAGMRQGTPSVMHDHVVTVFASPHAVRESVGAATTSDTWAYLLDRDGKVQYQRSGPFDRQKFQELASILSADLARSGAGVMGGSAA